MADIKSTDEFDDELLSAYVDEELDEEQRAQVEQRLREDPLAKQLVAELQSLSQTLRSLPREQVGKELRTAVLKQVESQQVSVASQEESRGSSRRWVWAAMAVAATLFLMISQPQENEEEKKLAQAEPQAGREVRSAPEMRAPLEAVVAEEMVADATFADESTVAAVMAEAEAADFEEKQDDEFGAETAETEELCLVYLTSPKPVAGRRRFDELLASNGIDLEKETVGAAEKGPSSSAVASNRHVPLSGESSNNLIETEGVLVEASRSQVEGLLEDCYADVQNLNSLSFRDQADSRLPVSRWRGFERKGELKKLGPTKANQAKLKKAYPSRGKATRVGTDWYQSQAQTHVAARGAGGLRQKVKEKPEVSRRRKVTKSDSADQVRVLFLFLPSEAVKE